MKKFLIIVIPIIAIFTTNVAQSYSSDPKLFVSELVNDAVSKLSNNDLNKDQKTKFIEGIAKENVDINALGLYTLGELRKSVEKSILTKYINTFEKYFLKSLTSRLTDYSSSGFEILNAEKKSSNYTIVKSKITASDNLSLIHI